MNHAHAREAAAHVAARYAGLSYLQLAMLIDGKPETSEVELSGRTYQVEFDASWDDRPGGVLRVCFLVDDGGIRAFLPLRLSKLLSPGDTFDGSMP